MSRQMATMIGAGLSLLRSLNILADQTENTSLARILGQGARRRRDRSLHFRRIRKTRRSISAADDQHDQSG